MQWFKHFSNASDSEKIKQMIDEFGLEGYARWFLFLELCTERFDGQNTELRIHNEEIKNKLRARKGDFVFKIFSFWKEKDLISFTFENNYFFLNIPILLELQNRDSKYNNKKRVPDAEDTRSERRLKNIDKNKELKNKEREEKEINKENICSFQNLENSISFTEVTNLFNQKLPREFSNKGRVKYAPNFANNTLLEKFDQILGHTDFKGPEGWIRLFNEVLESDFLMGISEKNFVVTLDWLLDTSNIRKVLGGQYSNGKDFAARESSARLNKMIDEYHASKAVE